MVLLVSDSAESRPAVTPLSCHARRVLRVIAMTPRREERDEQQVTSGAVCPSLAGWSGTACTGSLTC